MSYGALAEVAALTPRYAVAGTFTTSTNPPAARVTVWLTQVSAALDVQLAGRGYSTPITATDLNATMDLFTNDMAALMVEGARGTGRYAPNSKAIAERGGLYALLNNDIADFLDMIIIGDSVTAGSSAVTREDGFS